MTNGFYDGSAEADSTWPCAVFIADAAFDGDDPIQPAGDRAAPPRRLHTLGERVVCRVGHRQEVPLVVRSDGDRGLLDPLFGRA